MNILLTSVGRRKYLVEYFREALQGKGQVIATNSVFTNTLLAADYYELSPVIYDKTYIQFLIDLCKRKNISAITSLFDIDLPVLAANAKVFASEGVRFIGPSFETARISNDKFATFLLAQNAGVLHPATFDSVSSAIVALDEGRLKLPLVIKPRFGMGSIGVFVAEDREELNILSKKCKKTIFSSYLVHESQGEADKSVLIQEHLLGQECGLDLYNDLNGNLVSVIAKKKIQMRGGETDVGETIPSMPFRNFAEQVSRNLEFTGLLSVDCFQTEKGIYLLEINPRISGHYPFSHLAGVRYPDQLISWLEGGDTSAEWLTARDGIRGSKELNPQILLQND